MVDFQHVVTDWWQYIQQNVDVPEMKQRSNQFAKEHPMTAVFIFIAAILCSVPVLTFICLNTAFVICGFFSLFFVLSFFLITGAFILSFVLLIMGSIALVITCIIACFWYTFLGASSVFKINETPSTKSTDSNVTHPESPKEE